MDLEMAFVGMDGKVIQKRKQTRFRGILVLLWGECGVMLPGRM